MAVQLNHTIVWAHDHEATARFYADILGVPVTGRLGRFVALTLANNVTLDFARSPTKEIPGQHYAFLVAEEEWQRIFARITEKNIPYWADPHHTRPDETNTEYGGHGFYFDDPNGHNLEVMTTEYELD